MSRGGDPPPAGKIDAELRRTKELVERILNATVDAIVASDVQGNVVLFNRAAERLFGVSAAGAIGAPVRRLYPEGGFEEVVRLLYSAEQGGVGRLERVRRDVRGAGGETIPVALSAAIVYDEGGREEAIVEVCSDLRERLDIEAQLAAAREEPATKEKQAVAMELAGAAAHELNQPLTSVLGCAELLRKKLDPGSAHLRLVETIESEAERMAGVVRRLGSLTRYETKSYVGDTKIIDLDRCAPPDEAEAGRAVKKEGGS